MKWVSRIFSRLSSAEWVDFPGGSDDKASAYNAGDPGSISGSGRSPGEGNGNPLQCSCLDNPMDGGAWQTTVHGVSESHFLSFQCRVGTYYALILSSGFPPFLCIYPPSVKVRVLRCPSYAPPLMDEGCQRWGQPLCSPCCQHVRVQSHNGHQPHRPPFSVTHTAQGPCPKEAVLNRFPSLRKKKLTDGK